MAEGLGGAELEAPSSKLPLHEASLKPPPPLPLLLLLPSSLLSPPPPFKPLEPPPSKPPFPCGRGGGFKEGREEGGGASEGVLGRGSLAGTDFGQSLVCVPKVGAPKGGAPQGCPKACSRFHHNNFRDKDGSVLQRMIAFDFV